MSLHFDPEAGAVIVPARLLGPDAEVVARLALDTGATLSVLNWELVVFLGYDPGILPARIQIVTASSVEFVPQIAIEQIETLGKERRNFPVLCHSLPPSATVDGLLGLDFFRGERLVLDFRAGTVTVD